MTNSISTESTTATLSEETVSNKNDTMSNKFSYINSSLSASEIKGMVVMYIDPNNTKKVTIRYGKVISLGPVNMGVIPYNKFAHVGSVSTLKVKELNMKFITTKGLDFDGNMVDMLIQVDFFNSK